MPVPSVSITASSTPRAAPARCSARIATFESLAHQRSERHAVERQMVGHHHGAAFRSYSCGNSEAHAPHVGRRRPGFLHSVHYRLDQLSLVEPLDVTVHTVVHHEVRIHDAAQQLGASSIHSDYAPRRHARKLYGAT
jgi:hypothetical protein